MKTHKFEKFERRKVHKRFLKSVLLLCGVAVYAFYLYCVFFK